LLTGRCRDRARPADEKPNAVGTPSASATANAIADVAGRTPLRATTITADRLVQRTPCVKVRQYASSDRAHQRPDEPRPAYCFAWYQPSAAPGTNSHRCAEAKSAFKTQQVQGDQGKEPSSNGKEKSIQHLTPRCFAPLSNVPLQPRRLRIASAAVGCKRIGVGRHHAELTERQSLDAGATLTRGQKRLRHRAAVPFVSRVWHERDAFVSDRDKPAAWNLGSADPIVKHLQFETFRGHLLEDKDFGLEFCHAIS